MKYWKCPICFRQTKTEDNIVMSICPCCIVENELIEKKEGEDEN